MTTTMPTHASLSDGVHVVVEIDHETPGHRHTHRISLACGIKVDTTEKQMAELSDNGKPAKANAKHESSMAASHELAPRVSETEIAWLAARDDHENAIAVLEETAQLPKLRKLLDEAIDAWQAEARDGADTTKLVVLALACSLFSDGIHKLMADPKVSAAEAAAQEVVTEKQLAHDKRHADHLDAYQAHARANEEIAKHRPKPKMWQVGAKTTCVKCIAEVGDGHVDIVVKSPAPPRPEVPPEESSALYKEDVGA